MCNHSVREDMRRLGGTTRLIAYGIENAQLAERARYYARFGLVPVNRTTRGFERPAAAPGP